jgi:hypothetical protein
VSILSGDQLNRIQALFVDICRQGQDMRLNNRQLAASLSAMAERLAGPTSDNSPLERYINNPHGDNPDRKQPYDN